VLISNLGEDAGRLLDGGVYSKGDTYFIFPKSWPDMITFLIHHLRINSNISCLLTKMRRLHTKTVPPLLSRYSSTKWGRGGEGALIRERAIILNFGR